ncbi:L-iditol 2-dehydrogenase [Thaumasiovibrio subtropicus]|uniref:L-iditol 2-dehydrogenase n=1 Tax=Thaumasiovibrio subtropicus TaxID=1891207 RepID=UPI000B363D94|nr:L-iditol 2-dehydrogenase [Thaumasiovibrio subtropicus]
MSHTLHLNDQPLLQNRVALLSGANGGIGLSVAATYLASGAQCVIADIAPQPSEPLQHLLEEYKGKAIYCNCDVTSATQRQGLLAKTVSHFGQLDILFNNAAIFNMGPILTSTEEEFRQLFNVNVEGMFFLMQGAAQIMVDAGRGGKIINIASQAGRRGEALVAHYCATKATAISYTQSTALALAKHGINVNSIAPGVIDTPMWDQVDALFAHYENLPPGEKKRQVGQDVPLGRMGTPEDITGAALFLASSLSDYITAQTLNVDGGNVMS